ncbi:MAG: DUF2851 family protein [Alistipes sp.]|nr:DUF2851 family protein [Alistipes sp.]
MSTPKHTLEELKAGAASLACTHYIQELRGVDYESLLITLTCERMTRKYEEVLHIFEKVAGKSWNETFHIMLFRVLGGMDNRQAMTELASRVNSFMLMRERGSIINLEALLIGGSGLLDLYPDDDYTYRLRLEFDHLAAKYNIIPMLAGEWNLSSYYRHNHPTLRLAQIAACIHNPEFTIQNALTCSKRMHVYDLFSGKASQYWVDNFAAKPQGLSINDRIGQLKSDLLGINLIAPMMFSYGNYSSDSDMVGNATNLLEDIAAEHNRFTKPWFYAGVEPRDAFVSQGLLQLSKEYCTPRRCEECPLARILTR